MTPIEHYQALLTNHQILPDAEQITVMRKFQDIYDHLVARHSQNRLLRNLRVFRNKPICGLYLWGDVGIGKSFLMDCFFHHLPLKNKLRLHFHEFMQIVHKELKELQGKQNPLRIIAKNIASQTCVICFDELVVTDITDAMILGSLFELLYAENVCLIFTSNTRPEELYKNGIQRQRFLPAIQSIIKNSSVVHLSNQHDYRFRHCEQYPFYFSPANAVSERKLADLFDLIANGTSCCTQPLCIHDRHIPIKKQAKGVVWFNFSDICGIPRNQHDYLALTRQFHTILVSHITPIQSHQNDLARSFINFIDVLYDSKTKLIVSAEKPLDELYLCGRLLFEFTRTRSRITEMRTHEWHHKCDSHRS